jgi:hypothetical protein
MRNPPFGFVYVTPTQDEVEEWKRRYPNQSTRQYRLQCEDCDKRIWGSGIGIGSHRRACRGQCKI